jgi:hypothetical protein
VILIRNKWDSALWVWRWPPTYSEERPMKPESARTIHQRLVAKHMRLIARREKTIQRLVRLEAAATESKRAIARSQKRLDRILAAKTYTGGPTSTVVPEVVEELIGGLP